MIHLHPVYDTDPHFSIDAISRNITYLSSDPLIIIQGDHNSQRYTFEMPRFIDGHDMMLCNQVQVHYINIEADSGRRRESGLYLVTDLQISPDDENVVVCSWLISQNATSLIGSLNFVLRFACLNGDKITYLWGTSVFNGVAIATSIDNTSMVVEQYTDILETWYMELFMAGNVSINTINDAKDKALIAIDNAETASIDAATNAALSSIDTELNASLERLSNAETESVNNATESIDTARDNAVEEINYKINNTAEEVLNRLPTYNGEVDDSSEGIITITPDNITHIINSVDDLISAIDSGASNIVSKNTDDTTRYSFITSIYTNMPLHRYDEGDGLSVKLGRTIYDFSSNSFVTETVSLTGYINNRENALKLARYLNDDYAITKILEKTEPDPSIGRNLVLNSNQVYHGNNDNHIYIPISSYGKKVLTSGANIIISFDAFSIDNVAVIPQIGCSIVTVDKTSVLCDAGNRTIACKSADEVPNRYDFKGTFDNTGFTNTDTGYLYFNIMVNSTRPRITNVKLEIGDTATDWTPAPEDSE